MSKTIKNTSKKQQQQYVMKIGDQQLVQQISKTGTIVLNPTQDSEIQNLTLQQKLRIIFILLMIPSAMFVFFGNNKFKSDSDSVNMANLHAHQLGAMGGFGGAFGGGAFGGRGFGADFDRDHYHSRRRSDHELIREHLNRLDPRLRRHGQGSRDRQKEESKPNYDSNAEDKNHNYEKPKEEQMSSGQPEHEAEIPNFDELNDEQTFQRLLYPETDSEFTRNLLSRDEDIERHIENHINKNELNSDETRKESETIEKSEPEASKVAQTEKSSSEVNEVGGKLKVIVMWSPFFESWHLVPKGSQAFIDAKCPINKCTLTSDKLYANQSDAIVFNARDIVNYQMPDMRSPNQRWIFFTTESPNNSFFHDSDFTSNLFNWSWTYRQDSDIVFSYGYVEKIIAGHIYINNENKEEFNAFDAWRRRSKMIVSIINNCHTHSKRELYLSELIKHIDIDIYGKCGNHSCPQPIKDYEQCFKTLSHQYLFAIVFEQTYCKDYVTRNVFLALQHNLIPIVMTPANYSTILPPNSVINAINFSSPKDLADYILDIGADFNKYKTLFEWKRQYRVIYERKDLCQLCNKLHEDESQVKSYADIKSWWLDGAQCKQWNQTLNTFSHI